MMKMKMDTGVKNTGDQSLAGVMDTGFIIPMATTAYTMSGSIPGGGIGIGGIAAGATILTGTSSVPDSMWSGMRMVVGGGGRGMEDG